MVAGFLGTVIGLERAAAQSSGNPLILWCAWQGSNLRPSDSKSDALSN
jgi:hypothetical protein